MSKQNMMILGDIPDWFVKDLNNVENADQPVAQPQSTTG